MSIPNLTSNPSVRSVPAVGRQPLAVRFLLAAGLVGPLSFFVVAMVEGATRPGYNAWRAPTSTLALGPHGWLLTIALVVLGALLLSFAAGLRRVLSPGRGSTWGPILLAVSGLTFILEAIFATDPMLGYPPGAATTSTLHGTLHLVLSVLFEMPPFVAAAIVLARRFAQSPGGRSWVLYTVVTITVVVVLQVLASVTFLSNDPGTPYGLVQRLQFFTAQGWIAVVAVRLLSGPAFEQ